MTNATITLPDATAYVADLLTDRAGLTGALAAAHTFETNEAAEDLAMSAGDMLDTYGLHIEAAFAATLALLLVPHVMF